MNKYEVVYIIKPTVEAEERTALIEKFSAIITSYNGTVDSVEEMGTRRLAYAINYITEGYYVLMNYTAPAELPLELERNFRINDNVIRYLNIKKEA